MEEHAALERDLLAHEHSYWEAIKEKNAKLASRLTDDPCIVVGAQGVGELSRGALSKMLEGASYELNDFSLEGVRVRRLSNDIAVIAYKVRENLTMEGKELELEAYDSSVWIKRDGDWVCVVHTESPAGDPFGRH
jgi:hypothetical protein